jgi:hypothetical protein
MNLSEGTRTVEPEGPAASFESLREMWLVNLTCALSAFGSTSVVSVAKFGVCSEKLSASDHVQHQIEQTHLQECDMLTQDSMCA